MHNECITSPRDLFVVEYKNSKPNFITEDIVKGKLKKLIKLLKHQLI